MIVFKDLNKFKNSALVLFVCLFLFLKSAILRTSGLSGLAVLS